MTDGLVRLSKRMSELGLASRREADMYIERGLVLVDGARAVLGQKVYPHQKITLHRAVSDIQEQQVTVILNKPIGYVSGQAEDGYKPAKVLITPQNHWKQDPVRRRYSGNFLRHLVPAGRLDIDSTGLLILSQSGRVVKKIIGEDSTIDKEYIVRVKPYDPSLRSASKDQIRRLTCGIELDGRPLKPAIVQSINDDELRFILTEGKKRQIRRMCEIVGLKVLRLKRVRIGSIQLGGLPLGQWRYLEADSFQ